MKTKYTIKESTQITGNSLENTGDLIETIYAVNNGASYLADSFTEEEEAEELMNYYIEKTKENAFVVEISVWENKDNGEYMFFHK